MVPVRKFFAPEKSKAPREGLAAQPSKRGRGHPRKYATTATTASGRRGRGSAHPEVTIGGGGWASVGVDVRRSRGGWLATATQPPRPQLHSADMAIEFMLWVDRPEISWFQLRNFFAKVMPASELLGLWLQADGCCGGASCVEVEVTPHGHVYMNRGWQTFTRAQGLKGKCYLHLKFDGEATLFVKIFVSEGKRLGFCPEDAGLGSPVGGPSPEAGAAPPAAATPPMEGARATTATRTMTSRVATAFEL